MRYLFLLIILFPCTKAYTQDTFSIVAVDSITGEIGSAGASCLGVVGIAPNGAQIISDIIPGVGGIHSQALLNLSNKANARSRMEEGNSPQQIIDWLTANDIQSNPQVRQYGIVDLNSGNPRSAAFTGTNCMDYKNHITGPGYSIQGNILLGQQILDSMETRYLNTTGTLAGKLMAALQGANVVGADTRCDALGTSSLSSFIRVAAPGDTNGTFTLDLYMTYSNNPLDPLTVDPIDSLQTLYNLWLNTSVPAHHSSQLNNVNILTDENGEITFDLSRLQRNENPELILMDLSGRQLLQTVVTNKRYSLSANGNKPATGVYIYVFMLRNELLGIGKIVIR